MPFTPQTLEEKPYNACVTCVHIGKNCDGPNFLAMSTERWCEWCHLRKDYLNFTNATIAEKAGISKISVDRIMSGNVKDLRTTTMQAVTKALVNGSWGQYPCSLADATQTGNPELVEKCNKLQATLDKMAADHKAELLAVRAEDQRKVDFLQKQVAFKEQQMVIKDRQLDDRKAFLERKDRIIAMLCIVVAITTLVIISALVIDGLNPDIGFFWVK